MGHSGMHKAVCALFSNVIKTSIERFTVASFAPSFNQAEGSEGREGDNRQGEGKKIGSVPRRSLLLAMIIPVIYVGLLVPQEAAVRAW